MPSSSRGKSVTMGTSSQVIVVTRFATLKRASTMAFSCVEAVFAQCFMRRILARGPLSRVRLVTYTQEMGATTSARSSQATSVLAGRPPWASTGAFAKWGGLAEAVDGGSVVATLWL